MKTRRFRRTATSGRIGDTPLVGLGQFNGAETGTRSADRPRGQPRAFIVDDGFSRCLHFGPNYVQSEMKLDKPDQLHLAYTRRMMAFLLFHPQPKQVIIVGLGGGSLTKFCYRHLPNARVTTIEISEDVIRLAANFDVPPADTRMQIVHADAVDYFASPGDRADIVLLDGCDENGVDAAFCNERFYQTVRARLRHRGVLVANLVGSQETKSAHTALIADAFSGRTIVLNVSAEANRLVFAFNDPWAGPDWSAIEEKARKLERKYGLDFPAFARELKRSHYQQHSSGDH